MLKIKLAYMDLFLDAYQLIGILEALDNTRHDKPLAGRGKEIMNEYKRESRKHCNGDMSLKIERARVERAIGSEWYA